MAFNYSPTTLDDWTRSDEYHNKRLISPDDGLEGALKRSKENGLPDIAVSEAQGKFLHLLVRSHGFKRVLEVGTLGGYSTIWLARGVPEDGQVTTLEISEKHAKVAAENFKAAGVDSKIKLIVGSALETLPTIAADQPFDLVFIDADKPSNLDYFKHAKRLTKKGSVIIVDNVVRNGRVSIPEYTDANVEGVRRLLEYLATDKEVDATTLATVGTKGYDGFVYALRL
ncbi:S-adenosyl-L-methionine-dependent methyltransferase [Sistotremastrum niveocremeum HHB9708]|uniref:S-adenosyl-L-methionine-dependent methyltransferase n=2 Tax=Sistotremastraceae TaxID=3402574 RepID=A0A165AMN9_9AGAM|nr:S-adenosyl-L-methionine-dependent methyltransferase [Sistotremastrum niveocremeum HHB9708]KZT42121.1 S-adenosyl-L-methionine-dependent methyltransferase [Sistotremastrum suecicum HHB10207 ss-3]